MAFKPKGIGYDMAITVFSPDGSLYQVNYANEAVRRGATSVGVKSKEGVVLLADKKPPSSLVESKSYEKISQIDEGIGAATSGMIADTRVLVDRARLEAQIHKLTYDEEITVKALCKKVCDLIQVHTQYGGLRPFGASLIIAGENGERELYVTDPSGGYIGMKAAAIGAGKVFGTRALRERVQGRHNAGGSNHPRTESPQDLCGGTQCQARRTRHTEGQAIHTAPRKRD